MNSKLRMLNMKRIELEWLSIYRDAIYGFSILFIVFFHAFAINGVDYSFGHSGLRHFSTIMENGNVGVDVFLFLSGVFLYWSFQKRSIQEYVKRRLTRIFMPLFVVDGVYWIIRYIIINKEYLNFLTRITGIRFFLNGAADVWFVSCILLCYILYPCIYAVIYQDDRNISIIVRTTAVIVFLWFMCYALMVCDKARYDMIEIALTRLPVFVLGCGMGKAVYEKKSLPFSILFPAIAVAGFFSVLHFDILHGCFRRWFYLIGGVFLALLLASTFNILNWLTNGKSMILKGLSSVGRCSLEMYLSQGMVNQIYRLTDYYIVGDIKRFCIFVVLPSIPIAFVASHIVGAINQKIARKQKREALS